MSLNGSVEVEVECQGKDCHTHFCISTINAFTNCHLALQIKNPLTT